MSIGSFLAGMFLGGSSTTVVTNNHTTNIHVPVQYPKDWGSYTNEGKLEWLKDRCYWHEYYELKCSLHERAEARLIMTKPAEGESIYDKILNSIIKNRGDTTEAEQIFGEYLSKRYVGKPLTDATRAEIKAEVDRMNDYLRYHDSPTLQYSIIR